MANAGVREGGRYKAPVGSGFVTRGWASKSGSSVHIIKLGVYFVVISVYIDKIKYICEHTWPGLVSQIYTQVWL